MKGVGWFKESREWQDSDTLGWGEIVRISWPDLPTPTELLYSVPAQRSQLVGCYLSLKRYSLKSIPLMLSPLKTGQRVQRFLISSFHCPVNNRPITSPALLGTGLSSSGVTTVVNSGLVTGMLWSALKMPGHMAALSHPSYKAFLPIKLPARTLSKARFNPRLWVCMRAYCWKRAD